MAGMRSEGEDASGLESLEALEPSPSDDEDVLLEDEDEQDRDAVLQLPLGGDISIPTQEETEWLDEKSDIVFTCGPVSEFCRHSCELMH